MKRRTELAQAVHLHVALVHLAGAQLATADSKHSLSVASLHTSFGKNLLLLRLIVPSGTTCQKHPVAQVVLENSPVPLAVLKRTGLEAVEGELGFGRLQKLTQKVAEVVPVDCLSTITRALNF